MKAPVILVAALALAGCAKAVEITQPAPPISAPVTILQVKFSPYFVPGSFTAALDGKDVTAGFVPVAAPAGTSTMRLPDVPQGLTGGSPVPGSVPPPSVNGVVDPRGPTTTPVAVPTLPTPSGGTPGKPVPAIAFYTHQLHVEGKCNGIFCQVTDDRSFFPLHIAGNPTTLSLKVGQKAEVTLSTYPENSVPITVLVSPSSGSVRLNGQPAGTPITVVIPPKGVSFPFTVTGVISSNLLLFLDAQGTQRGSIQGVVNN
jgi:hypothetical protein